MNKQEPRTVAVVGLGYVGLTLAVLLADRRYRVYGIEMNPSKVRALEIGNSYVPDLPNEQVASLIRSKQLMPTTMYEVVREAEVVIICVPTPLTESREPDLHHVIDAAARIEPHLRQGTLVILESSTYPGTTRTVLQPILERGGRTVGKDFFLAFSPERIDVGRSILLRDVPKIAGGITPACQAAVQGFYGYVFTSFIAADSAEAAEMAKLLENSYRFVNISFINEMAKLCDSMGINLWEAIDLAATKPFGFMAFYPGPGVGGHCIPVDPLYLTWKARQQGGSSSLIDAADSFNREMPAYLLTRIKGFLQAETLEKASILLCGMAYKKDIGDIRESAAVKLLRLLLHEKANVCYHDPHVPELQFPEQGRTLRSMPLTEETIRSQACIVILTDHSSLPIDRIVELARLVFDTRNATKHYPNHPRIRRLGDGRQGGI